MITIGLTTWFDHPSLIKEDRQVRLDEYAARFPTVEVDNPFYGIPTTSTVRQWQTAVPETFQFILKANREMTMHPQDDRMKDPVTDEARRKIFQDYQQMLQPLVATNQLKTVLFQFPPYFKAEPDNFTYLRKIRAMMPTTPISVEFRNASWFDPVIFNQLTEYFKDLKFTLVAADEAQTAIGSVPFNLSVTSPHLAFIRLHGRNLEGWGNAGPEWRKKRTLYRYNETELEQLKQAIDKIKPQVKEVCVIFNNNSGHDAADNALQLQKMMNLKFNGLAKRPPEQLDLF
ncbi:DUF72 domain-containing protein [Paucilactobacillus suebicus]|uniref:DUF72 domain-containing protein n=1 Tax=Paucilactobacillus suebicus DSM 5007 = KCTC 3549 TaxID=1423807 RepID=A0A0R1W144_9LACO|nr:DUF72 domain-containing protein [Paucilactobacillus suebicus]KRM11330.1 hypothetical protein FD16_GL000919 [Paucilactobacillus suebicus DSM 5007 = KCTC 3549]